MTTDDIAKQITDEATKRFIGNEIDLASMKREDGILTRAKQENGSLLHKVIRAIESNDDYRQELKTANFDTSDEADLATAALEECRELGMDPTPIIDRMIARSAGKNHGLLRLILDALNNSSFKVTQTPYKKNQNNSPIGEVKQ